MTEPCRAITAYEIHDPAGMPIEPAPIEREWMETSDRFAYRCLPLVVANQSGWIVRSPAAFLARWNGGPRKEDVEIQFEPPASRAQETSAVLYAWAGGGGRSADAPAAQSEVDPRVASHFGLGVVTFSLPYLFRTPPGINLWVKGPSNWIKDGAQALEGIVETDWCPATFTMNWKLTRPGRIVRFERGEPICMLVPLPRDLLESLVPRQAPLEAAPDVAAEYHSWQASRSDFLTGLVEQRQETVARGWEKDYFQGRTRDGGHFAGHQTRLKLRPFGGE
jgi:hypothetical protein